MASPQSGHIGEVILVYHAQCTPGRCAFQSSSSGLHLDHDACDGGSFQSDHGGISAAAGGEVFIDNVTKSQNQRKQKELGESAEMTEMVLAKFINEPRAGDNSKDMLKRISEDALKKLASLTDAGRSRNQAELRRVANEAFHLLEECHINITREVFQAWLKDPEFVAWLLPVSVTFRVSFVVKVLEEAEVDISNKLLAQHLPGRFWVVVRWSDRAGPAATESWRERSCHRNHGHV
eukprot:Skav221677  [mRNA]  locus=scaffold1494:22335:28123:+ [translate_table: standard]